MCVCGRACVFICVVIYFICACVHALLLHLGVCVHLGEYGYVYESFEENVLVLIKNVNNLRMQ